MPTKKRSAKGQFVAGAGARAARKSRATKATPIARKRRRRRNPDAGAALVKSSPTVNPPPMRDLVEFILPSFAGYGATKLIARIAYIQLSKKFPKAGKHLAVGSTIASFLAAYYLVHRIKKIQDYHTPIVIGSAIAALQAIVAQYLPKYGWMVSGLPNDGEAPQFTTNGKPTETLFPGGPEVVGDDDDAVDIDDIDLGSLGAQGADAAGDDDYLGLN